MDVEHSRLLKFILPEGFSFKTKMAEAVKNIEDSNVEAEVPTKQTIRKTLNNENGECEHYPENHTAVVAKITQHQALVIDDNDDRKRTKIPVSRFRQTVERVTANRRASGTNDEPQTTRKSSIPKPTRPAPTKPERKSLPKLKPKETLTINLITTEQETRKPETNELEPETVAPEDEFDKLYEEVAHSPVNIDISLLNPKVDDPEKVEHNFEEIIHDYDENKVKPIDVETIKRSKIPYLKRQSFQEDRNSKIIAARDKIRLRQNSTKSDHDTNDEDVKQDHNIEDNIEVIVKNNDNDRKDNDFIVKHTKTVNASKFNEGDDTIKVVSTTSVTEVKSIENSDKIKPMKGQIIIENIQKEFVKVGIPVFDSYVLEHTENIEGEKRVKNDNDILKVDNETGSLINITEIIDDNEPASTDNPEPNIDWNDFDCLKHEATPEEQIEVEDTSQKLIERDGIFDPLLRESSRALNRHVSHETINKDALEIEIGNKLPKKESVMSKIALFERQDTNKSKIPKQESRLPKLAISTLTTEKIHVHTPLIVDEIYKCDSISDLNNQDNKINITTNSDEAISEIVQAEIVFIESPVLVRSDKDNKIQITTMNTPVEKAVKEEVLTPVLRKFEPKHDENTHENSRALKDNDFSKTNPIVVPKYIPVREVLKRYESLNEQNQNKKPAHLSKRSISEMRNIPKIGGNERSLDSMFVRHKKPVSEILKDIHTAEIMDENKKENIFFANIPNKNIEGKKTDSNSSLNKFKNETNIENTEIKANGKIDKNKFKIFDFNEEFKKPELDYKTLDSGDDKFKSLEFIQDYVKAKDDMRRTTSIAELDLGYAVKGKVNKIINRINSLDLLEERNQTIVKDLPRKRSVSEKIALFERKLTPAKETLPPRTKEEKAVSQDLTADMHIKIEELSRAKKYGTVEVPSIELANGINMPVLAVGTALLDPGLVYHVICAAIDLGYRAIDSAYIYGNEKEVGQAIRDKIQDGTVKREDLFITSKLWSTFHRTDLVKEACEASLTAMGLDYFDLFLIHNPMSFKEGGSPLPRIATVLQYSSHDYLDAWYGMEALGGKARAIGLSNFNSHQIARVLDRAKVKPVVNQVECHPYLTQQKLSNFCAERNITLSCYGVLGSKGTPLEYKSGNEAVIDDPLVQVMASGLNVTPAQLLIRYQIQSGHTVVVKTSSAARLWENLQCLTFQLTEVQMDALHALNRNKRTFLFKGMGDTHKNYPFNTSF